MKNQILAKKKSQLDHRDIRYSNNVFKDSLRGENEFSIYEVDKSKMRISKQIKRYMSITKPTSSEQKCEQQSLFLKQAKTKPEKKKLKRNKKTSKINRLMEKKDSPLIQKEFFKLLENLMIKKHCMTHNDVLILKKMPFQEALNQLNQFFESKENSLTTNDYSVVF